MKQDYKKDQQEARDAYRKSRYGKKVMCRNCYKPVGAKYSQPILRKASEEGKIYYIHREC